MKKFNIAIISIITLTFLTGCWFDSSGIEGSSSLPTSDLETMSKFETTEISNTTIENLTENLTGNFPTTDHIITSSGHHNETDDIIDSTTLNLTSTSNLTSSSTDSSTNSENSICGNEIIELGEECDEGPISTKNCDSNCKLIICGDGIVSGLEICDDGNDFELDDCSNDCFTPRWVFLTNDYIGPANFGGLAVADAYCQKDADTFGLKGKFIAWLSDDDPSNSPVFRMETNFQGWYLLRSPFPSPLAKGWIELTTVDLQSKLNIGTNGISDPLVTSVWTATNPDGTRAEGSTCNNWTFLGMGSEYQVVAGNPQTLEHNGWSTGIIKSCSSGVGAKLYCFQVGEII